MVIALISSSDNKSNNIHSHLGGGGAGEPNICVLAPQSVVLDKFPLNRISTIEKNIQTFQEHFLFYCSFSPSFMKKTVFRPFAVHCLM